MNYKVKIQRLRLQIALASLSIIEESEALIGQGVDVQKNKQLIAEQEVKYAETLSNLFQSVTGDIALDVTETFYHEQS